MTTIKKAINRLKWRFENGIFTPNENDFTALNFIIEWVNNEKVEMIENNEFLAKIYIQLLRYELLKYDDAKFASNQLNKKLMKISMEQIIEEFTDTLNLIEYQCFLKSKGLTLENPLILTYEESEMEKRIINENENEFLKVTVDGKWTKDQVKAALFNQLTELIKLK